MKPLLSLFILILILTGLGGDISAQDDDLLMQNFMFDTRMGFTLAIPTRVSGLQNPDEGAFHYLQNEWEEAVILSPEDERAKTEARYDIRWDQVILRHEGQLVQLLPQKTKAIVLGQTLMVPQLFHPEGENFARLGWFELLTNGDIQLLKRYKLEKRTRDIQPGMLNQEGNFKWVVISELFVKNGNEPPRPFKPNKRNMLDLFGKKRSSMEAFIKKEGLKYRKEEDLKAMITHFNTLLKEERAGSRE